jgi:hypothetical protein
MPKVKPVFSSVLVNAINQVNQDVAYEIHFGGIRSSAKRRLILAETCLDARRMTMSGMPEADAEVDRLVKEFGYDAVLKEAANHVCEA